MMYRSWLRALLCILLSVVAATTLGAPAAAQSNPSSQEVQESENLGLAPIPSALRQAMMQGDTREALRILQALETNDPEHADGWRYLKAKALADNGQLDEALATLEGIERDFPEGLWIFKARFARAELLRGLGRHAEAEAIYEAEAERLMSAERRSELAEVYLNFARLLSTKPEVEVPGSKVPNYERARLLYRKVLELEIPDQLREESLWGIAHCSDQLSQWNESLPAYRAYLAAFGDRMELVGVRAMEARYRAALSATHVGQTLPARYAFEDLVALLEEASSESVASENARELKRLMVEGGEEVVARLKQLEGRARFSIAQTHQGNAQALALRVAGLERFLTALPEHEWVGRARFTIADSLRQAGRLTEALEAYQAYLAWESPQNLETEYVEQNARYRQQALYQAGLVQMSLGEPAAAIRIFQDYIGRYPSGAEWASAQQALVNAEYAVGESARGKKQWQAARDAWNEFLTRHPLDGRASMLAYTFGKMYVEEAAEIEGDSAEAQAQRMELWRRAEAAWAKAASKYPKTDAASLALYETGVLLERRIQNLPEAILAYRACNFGRSAGQAALRLQEMTTTTLGVRTPKVWRSNEDIQVVADVRNSDKLTMRVYALDLEAYFRKHLTHQRIEDLDLDLIAPNHTVEIPIEGYEEYKPITQEITVPVEGAGVWAVAIDDGERRATTLVVRSDIDMIVKSSRREFFVYAQDMLKDRPASGVEVLLALPDPQGGAPTLHVLKTGRDGVARQELEDLILRPELRVLASKEGNFASDGLTVAEYSLTNGLQPRGYIYSDRTAYRPGQRVNWRAVIREASDGKFYFEPGAEYVASVYDSEGQLFRTQQVELSEFGTVHGDFLLPVGAPMGNWTVSVAQPSGQNFSGYFHVQEFELQSAELTLDFDQAVYYRGETVTGVAEARYYYGEPLVGRAVLVNMPDGRELRFETDGDGRASFEIPTRDLPASTTLSVSASLPEENLYAQSSVWVSALGFSAAVMVDQDVILAGTSFATRIATASAAGEPVARDLELSVARVEQSASPGRTEVVISEEELSTDDEGRASISLTLEEGGDYILRARGIDRFGNPVVGQRKIFVSGESDAQRLRILTDRNTVPVGSEVTARVVNRTGAKRALVTYEGERVLGYRILELDSGVNELEVPTEVDLAPNFQLAVAMMERGKLHTASAQFQLERRLRLKIQPESEVVKPGEEVVVALTAEDELGNPVEAEVSMAVVDESIFAQFPDRTTWINPFFKQDAWRSVGFATTSSCEFRYDGRTEEIAAALLAEVERLAAAQTWDEGRDELRAELMKLQEYGAETYRGASDTVPLSNFGVPVAPRLSAGLSPQPQVYFATPDMDADALFDSQTFNHVIGIGGGAGGMMGGRAGGIRGRRGGGEELAYRLAYKAAMDPDAGEVATWVNEGLAFWTPSVVTGADGKAELRFTMPDRSAEWRMTGRGVGRSDHFGQALGKVVSRAPFFAELRTPMSLTEGDQPIVQARVHNLLEESASVAAVLRITMGDQSLSLPVEAELEAGGEAELRFPIASGIPLTDEVRFQLTTVARVGEESITHQTQSRSAVRPWGMAVADFASGLLTSETQFELALPEGKDYRDLRFELNFGHSLTELVVEAALDRNPFHGWHGKRMPSTEAATASRLIGACAALEMLRALGEDHPDAAALRNRVEALVASLTASQRDEGGWTWSGGEQGAIEPEISARVMHALAIARATGQRVPGATLDRGVNYLAGAFQAAGQREHERKAVILHALAMHDRGDFGALNRLHRLRSELSPAALAYTAMALAEMDRAPMAAEVAQILATKVDMQGACDTTSNMAWSRGRIEMTALAAWALQEAMPRSEAARRSVDYLLAQRPWPTGAARGLASGAVAKWVEVARPEASDALVTVEINGESSQLDLSEGRMSGFTIEDFGGKRATVKLTLEGRGRPYFHAAIHGFTRDVAEQNHRDFRITRHLYEAAQPVYDGKAIPTGFGVMSQTKEPWYNEVSQLERGGRTRVSLSYYQMPRENRDQQNFSYLTLRVPIPAGTSLVHGSLQGRYERVQQRGQELIVYLGRAQGSGYLNYELVGTLPGDFRTLPARLEDAVDPSRYAMGPARDMKVLEKGQASTDDYRATPDELYHLGLAAHLAGDEETSYTLLSRLYDEFGNNLRDQPLASAAGKLLFLAIDRGSASEVVRYFEVLKEKNPQLNIPFDRVLSVGRAYRELEEYERATLVFRATIEESFGKDIKIAGTLEEQGEPSGSLAVLEELWRNFPDFPVVVETYLTLSDKLLTLAPTAHQSPGLVASGLGRTELTKAGMGLLQRFMALYHDDPLAAEAGLNLVAAYLDLEDFETTVKLSREMATAFSDPRFFDAFRYSEAVAQWYLGEEKEAVKVLQAIASAEYEMPGGTKQASENRDLALYILAQIHHAQRRFGEAAEYYARVETVFADAREVLRNFQAKQIAMDEVTEAAPGERVNLELRYRNITEAELLVYKVDLMTLYLRERNLSRVTEVNLAGIAPTLKRSLKLSSETGMREASEEVRLSLKDPGAYLVICRGDELHTSGLVLVSDIELEVDPDAGAGRFRIQALDRKKGRFAHDVDVRVVGDGGGDFVTGRTDPRGMFIADGVAGAATVIARLGDHHYAFYRDPRIIARMEAEALGRDMAGFELQMGEQLEAQDYFQNVIKMNADNQAGRAYRYQQEVQRERKGVSVGQTRSK